MPSVSPMNDRRDDAPVRRHVPVPAWVEQALAESDYSPALKATLRRKIECGEIEAGEESDFLTLLERLAEEKPRD